MVGGVMEGAVMKKRVFAWLAMLMVLTACSPPAVVAPEPPASVDPRDVAQSVLGFGTTYNATHHAQSWYDAKSTWVSVDPQNQRLTQKKCNRHPEWQCYKEDMGSWKKLVRPWRSPLKHLYAAIGPYLRQRLQGQMPRWHQIPTHKLLITSLITGLSVEVWIVDYCACGGGDKKQGTSDDPLVDLSPQVWDKLGAYKDNRGGPNIKGWSNRIEVRFLP